LFGGVLVFVFVVGGPGEVVRSSEDDAGDEEAGDKEAPAFDRPRGQPISDARHCGLRPDFVLLIEVSHQSLLWLPVFSRHGHRESNLRASFSLTRHLVVFDQFYLFRAVETSAIW
jgi:hypothetical protein